MTVLFTILAVLVLVLAIVAVFYLIKFLRMLSDANTIYEFIKEKLGVAISKGWFYAIVVSFILIVVGIIAGLLWFAYYLSPFKF